MAQFTSLRNRPLYDAIIDAANAKMSEPFREKLYGGEAGPALTAWQTFEKAVFEFCKAQDLPSKTECINPKASDAGFKVAFCPHCNP